MLELLSIKERKRTLMFKQLREKLASAEGRSEFVIAVVCDIRGFSAFSTCHESPDIAMFIKRFYLRLINDYFINAVFAKPTGDGLLIIYRYSEQDLDDVSKDVLSTCIKALNDFPSMFNDDSMINFLTPHNLGFGISRGPTCCIFSGRTILDYSGQLLNLAARLNDYARPKGIVLDGNYLEKVIPKTLRSRFVPLDVYIRGIAEDTPRTVLYLIPEVSIPSYALMPISTQEWVSVEYELTVSELNKIEGSFQLNLQEEPLSIANSKLEFVWPNPKIERFTSSRIYEKFKCYRDAKGHHVRFNVDQAKQIVKKHGITRTKIVSFRFQFMPKPTS